MKGTASLTLETTFTYLSLNFCYFLNHLHINYLLELWCIALSVLYINNQTIVEEEDAASLMCIDNMQEYLMNDINPWLNTCTKWDVAVFVMFGKSYLDFECAASH